MNASKAAPLMGQYEKSDEVFESASQIFRVMAAPMRLRIINSLCEGEKNVGELLAEISTTQPNMSQHLNTLFKAGILGKRRVGVQIYYCIINEQVVSICRAVCQQVESQPPRSLGRLART